MQKNKVTQAVTALYTFEMISQSLFTLVLPVGIGFGAAYFLTRRFDFPDWIYVPFLLAGTFLGLYSMISYILTVSRQMEALEKQAHEKEKTKGSGKGGK